MKGIILAGGSGSRLYPITIAVSKQLLPVYDKPMIYYPLSVLMLAGIKDILFITTPHDQEAFKKLLGDGSQLGCNFEYEIQEEPNGLAEAFIIGEKFIGDDNVALVLGDNIFYGAGFQRLLWDAINTVKEGKAVVFGNYVQDPERYGVAEFDKNNNVLGIEEKPEQPKSNFAVAGLYFYPNSVIEIAKDVKPSFRNELEITSVNQAYLKEGDLKVQKMGRGFAWFDTGTHEALAEATEFVKTIEKRTGLKIGCLEEIAIHQQWIQKETVLNNIRDNRGDYFKYLQRMDRK